ncbi:hypothetical protein JX266_011148 [Neoarthrinium moseri]|nr:hypothetical protein JX266_011148 [Neoarthrinium moseri]
MALPPDPGLAYPPETLPVQYAGPGTHTTVSSEHVIPNPRSRPPNILQPLMTRPVPGTVPDSFSPRSPTGEELKKTLIPTQHRKKLQEAEPINPDYYYGLPPPKPLAWGPIDQKSGQPMFKYTDEGELDWEPLSRDRIREYLYDIPSKSTREWKKRVPLDGERMVEGKRRSGLTLWIGWMPAQSTSRFPNDNRRACRFEDCACEKKSIKAGQLRVIFDERMNEDGSKYNPYHCAGYVHLYCLEKHFDILKLMRDLDVRLDVREFVKEAANPGSLIYRDSGQQAVALQWLNEQWPYLQQHEDRVANKRARVAGGALGRKERERPRHFDDSLTKRLTIRWTRNYSTPGKKAREKRRETAQEGREPCDAEMHMGNLEYYDACMINKRHLRNNQECASASELAYSGTHPYAWHVDPLQIPDFYVYDMFTSGFVPGLQERLGPQQSARPLPALHHAEYYTAPYAEQYPPVLNEQSHPVFQYELLLRSPAPETFHTSKRKSVDAGHDVATIYEPERRGSKRQCIGNQDPYTATQLSSQLVVPPYSDEAAGTINPLLINQTQSEHVPSDFAVAMPQVTPLGLPPKRSHDDMLNLQYDELAYDTQAYQVDPPGPKRVRFEGINELLPEITPFLGECFDPGLVIPNGLPNEYSNGDQWGQHCPYSGASAVPALDASNSLPPIASVVGLDVLDQMPPDSYTDDFSTYGQGTWDVSTADGQTVLDPADHQNIDEYLAQALQHDQGQGEQRPPSPLPPPLSSPVPPPAAAAVEPATPAIKQEPRDGQDQNGIAMVEPFTSAINQGRDGDEDQDSAAIAPPRRARSV